VPNESMPVPVSGFSIVRNAVTYGYPVLESLRSLLPLVDELVIAVGHSDDGTLELVRSLDDPRLVIIETVWDDSLRQGGRVLAQQTNLALTRCRHPWAFYLQADEVIHEHDHPRIARALERVHGSEDVDALWFRFLHFEGTYAYVNRLRYWRQCRIVRNDGRLESVGDAAGFGRRDGARLRMRPSGARIFHYGWARAPGVLREKTLAFQRLYHEDDAAIAARWGQIPAEYLSDVDIAFRFRGTHPAVMRDVIGQANWAVPKDRRPLFGTPLLHARFYGELLRKWRVLPRK
jgi:glycosyltransferase involved in cell wall biosynthesis